MQLNNAALDRLKLAKFNADTTVSLFGLLAAQADLFSSPGGALTLDYYQPGDDVQPGDLIPVMTFSLRPYELSELNATEVIQP